ncbi:amidohydrolase family protein [Sodalis ligni]|uniref:Putative TIM-barrel fold metal-dependent hydrolase n=1 Tax=Sodalis ligni TaxID=2697027 RepID=A0A4R1NGG0_9GAMM|nr:amidohydrolase family protein [Sodalis ligni]TCL06097.1 putative TIM-barrel fold metal-dependent hydrolase [Sodalis ligni]
MKLLDTHTHVISPDNKRYPTDPIGGHQSQWSQARPVDADSLLRAMDAADIEQAVVVQASTVYGHDNRYVADTVRAHRDRLVGVYSLDALAADAVDKIIYWQEQGLSGFRLFTTGSTMPGQGDWLGHVDSYPAWAWAEAHAIPVCLQMTMEGIPALRSLLERFPKAIVLLDHCARPVLSAGAPYQAADALLALAAFPGVHLKLTNRTLAAAAEGKSTPIDFLRTIIAAFGADHIAWGSNFPAAAGTLAELANTAREVLGGLSVQDRQAIAGGTARRLYPFASTEQR